MQLGMIGLGRMGANMVRRLLRGGHQCVVYNRSPAAVEALVTEGGAARQRGHRCRWREFLLHRRYTTEPGAGCQRDLLHRRRDERWSLGLGTRVLLDDWRPESCGRTS